MDQVNRNNSTHSVEFSLVQKHSRAVSDECTVYDGDEGSVSVTPAKSDVYCALVEDIDICLT